MYVHGVWLLPDYVAFTLLAVIFTFLACIAFYGIAELLKTTTQCTEMDIFNSVHEPSSGRSLVAGQGLPEPLTRVRIPAAASFNFGLESLQKPESWESQPAVLFMGLLNGHNV